MAGSTAAAVINADAGNGIRGLVVSFNPERVHRSGEEVTIYFNFTNTNSRDIKGGAYMSMDDCTVAVDGESGYRIDASRRTLDFPAEETVTMETWIPDLPKNAKAITFLKLVGRAAYSSKVSATNSYGDFDYKYTNIVLPGFPESNLPGCVFYDNEVALNVGGISVDGRDLVVDFTLTNIGRKDFSVDLKDFGSGTARTVDGDEYKVSTRIADSLPAGEPVKGQIVISGGANEMFATVKQGFMLFRDGSRWEPDLILRNIAK